LLEQENKAKRQSFMADFMQEMHLDGEAEVQIDIDN
jgi:hypothetical protein